MKRTIMIMLTASLLVLILAAGAIAKEKKPKAASTKEDRLSGTIHMINKDTKTITLRKGNVQRQVIWDDNTKITYRNKPGSMDDVKEGRRVIVFGKFNDRTQLVATRIDLMSNGHRWP